MIGIVGFPPEIIVTRHSQHDKIAGRIVAGCRSVLSTIECSASGGVQKDAKHGL
jgi:hypothetical protein